MKIEKDKKRIILEIALAVNSELFSKNGITYSAFKMAEDKLFKMLKDEETSGPL